MGIFVRFLSLWVALAIVAGVALGALFPGAAAAIEALQVARINLPIAAGGSLQSKPYVKNCQLTRELEISDMVEFSYHHELASS